jgi:outer membrane protein assembly factor BamB
MMNTKGNRVLVTIALVLMLTIAVSIVALPAANAHTPPWTIPTYAYISVEPNPVGVGQAAFVNFWLDKVPPTANGAYGDRWQNFTVTVTKPNGNTETLGPFTSDDVGGAFTTYTPDTLGNYTFVFKFPGQTIAGANPAPGGFTFNVQQVGDIYQPSTSRTVTLVVQQESIQPYPTTPLPTSYWTRPIFAENTAWYSISGNWLGAGPYNATTNFNPYTTAPNTAHIVWTKPYAPGGLIGGEFGGNEVNSNYYSTAQYETKFAPIIMNGVLYYTLVPGSQTSPQGWVAADLRTGETIWTHTPPPSIPGPGAGTAVFSSPNATTLLRGQIMDFVSPNQYGGLLYLWTNEPTVTPNTGSTYGMYDAMTGNWILNIVNGTSATFVSDKSATETQGTILGYYINTTDWTLNMWNSTRAILRGPSGTGDLKNWLWRPQQGASIPWQYGIQWSVPMTTTMTASNGTVVNINAAYAESAGVSSPLAISRIADVILVTNIPGPTIGFQQPGYIIVEAYSLKTGQLLWGPLNQTQAPWCRLSLSAVGEGVYTIFTYETQTYSGYSQATGEKLWGPVSTANPEVPWGYYVTSAMIGYGNLYSSDFGGYVYCFDVKTGTRKWTFWTGSGGYETPYGVWPIVNFECIADGKIYVMGGHLYSPPLFHGGQLYCINATSGDLIWSSPSFAITNGANCGISDGYLVVPNAYDNRLYCYGKGQTATTVEAPMTAITAGDSVVIQGTVTDQSSGAKGTPAISDASMGAWMEFIYMQQPCPTNATGVEVTIDAVDPNNNFINIGTATSDAYGTFGYAWKTPNVPGKYMIIATFAGSESYYASYAETYAVVSEAPAATPTPTPLTLPPTETYFAVSTIAIIIAIAVAVVLLLRKK